MASDEMLDEIRRADFLEELLEQLEQGRPLAPVGLAGASGLLDDLRIVLSAAEGLQSARSQMVGDVLDLCEGGGDPAPVLPDPFPGEFRIRGSLGHGAFGAVWLADDLHLDRQVALKSVLPTGRRPLDERLARLREEARRLASIEHRHIVQVYAHRESADGSCYLVMQYVRGGSLDDRVQQEGPLPWQDAARYVADVGDGLLAVHARGIVHRDVKPANILWDSDRDIALLTDFGVSVRLGEVGTSGGTPSYMPPEAFAGKVGPAQDVYGLAASLFWLVTGSTPFSGATPAQIVRQSELGLANPDPRCSALPAPLERLLRAGLAADPERRPTLAEFASSLRAVLNQLLVDRVAGLTGSGGGCAPGHQPPHRPEHLRPRECLTPRGAARRARRLARSGRAGSGSGEDRGAASH